jgi:hypothetical protein
MLADNLLEEQEYSIDATYTGNENIENDTTVSGFDYNPADKDLYKDNYTSIEDIQTGVTFENLKNKKIKINNTKENLKKKLNINSEIFNNNLIVNNLQKEYRNDYTSMEHEKIELDDNLDIQTVKIMEDFLDEQKLNNILFDAFRDRFNNRNPNTNDSDLFQLDWGENSHM